MIDQEHLITVVREQRLLWDKRHKNYRNRLLTKKAWKNVAETLGCTSDEAQSKWKNLRDSFSRELKKIPKRQSGELEVAEYTGDWHYFAAMQFLKGVIRTRKTNTKVRQRLREEADAVDEESIVSVMSNSSEISSNTDNQVHNVQSEFDNFPDGLATENQCGSNQSTSSAHVEGDILSPDILQKDYLSYGVPRTAEDNNMRQNDYAVLFADLERQKIDLLKREMVYQDDEDMNWFKSILPHLKTLPPLNKFLFRTKVQEMLFNELTKQNSSQPASSTATSTTQSSSSTTPSNTM